MHNNRFWSGRPKINQTEFKPGAYNQICDRTGVKIKSTETQHEWTGNTVRLKSWEPRNSQDLLRTVRDNQQVFDPNPEPTQDTFITLLNFQLIDPAYFLQLIRGGNLEVIG